MPNEDEPVQYGLSATAYAQSEDAHLRQSGLIRPEAGQSVVTGVLYGRGVAQQQHADAERAAAVLDELVSAPSTPARPSIVATPLRVRYEAADDAYETTTVSGHVFRVYRSEVEDIGLPGGRSLSERLDQAIRSRRMVPVRWDESAYSEAQRTAAPTLTSAPPTTSQAVQFARESIAATQREIDRVAALEPEVTQKEWLEDILDLMRAYDVNMKPEFDAEVIRYIRSMSHTIQAALISFGALED